MITLYDIHLSPIISLLLVFLSPDWWRSNVVRIWVAVTALTRLVMFKSSTNDRSSIHVYGTDANPVQKSE